MAENAAPVTLGAQILRKMHGCYKQMAEELAPLHDALDESEVKNFIGEHLKGHGASMQTVQKFFKGAYKGLDLEEEKKPEDEPKEEKALAVTPPAVPAVEKALTPEPEPITPVDDLGPLYGQLARLESLVRHENRLRRVAASRR